MTPSYNCSAKGLEAVRFFEEGLVHTKGRWAGVKFTLADWQRDEIILPLFGNVDKNGKRIHKTAYIECGRKNGKSEIAAGIALKLLVADGEQGAEIYGAASDRDQASIVFHVAADMVRRSPHLSKVCKIVDSQKRIIYPKTSSFYRAIPAEVAGAHGYNAHGIIFDEVHAQGANRELWDVLTTSTSAREQPLVFAITTAGYDRQSICWELHEYAQQVIAGTVSDPTFFARIWALPEDADWTDERDWGLANPGLGDFRSLDELREMVARAKVTPALQNTIRRLYFSQWTSSESRWFDIEQWRACGGVLGDLTGKECFGGLDLSSTTDYSAWVLYFPEGCKVLTTIFVPEAQLRKHSPMRPQLQTWAKNGDIEVTPGDVIDYDFIKARILKDASRYDIREVGFDPWSAVQLSVQLESELGTGVMVPVRQGFATLSAPAKLLETLVARGELNHGGHPVLAYMADNVVLETDSGGNIKPSKKRSTQRIDGIAALVTALERAMHAQVVEADFYSFG